MSQRDVLAELRTARVEAPPQLRARVRLIAAQAPTPRRTRRRFAVVLVPVVAAAIAAGVFFSTRSTSHPTVAHGFAAQSTLRALAPAPSAKRLQRYGATLHVQVRDVQKSVAEAQQIAGSLSGFVASVHISVAKTHGSADLVLRVPRTNVQKAVARLSRLGTVTSEQVEIQDLQAGVNTLDRTIAKLERELKTASKDQAAVLTARIKALQRQRASAVRTAHFATVRLGLSTPPVTHRRSHFDIWPWLGGAAAALVLVLAWRILLRLREARLLSRP